MIKFQLIFILSVVIASFSQILLKKSANIKRNNKISEYINVFVISAYGMLLISTILTMCAYKKLQLSQGMILESLSYIIVPVLSYMFLKEKISLKEIVGIITIILGIIIFSILG
ncbi:MAG: EamA family transporter [Clostridia bacterium]